MPKFYQPVKEWFDLEDDPMGGRILLKHLEPHEIERIAAKCTRTVNRLDADNQFERVQELDLALDRQMTVDACVPEWENFYGPDGEPLPCDSDNRRRWAMDNWFMGHVRAKRKLLAEQVAAQREAAAKN